MNELDKLSPATDDRNRDEVEAVATTVTNENASVEEKAEETVVEETVATTTPAEIESSEECAETVIEEEEPADTKGAGFHAMNKEELLVALKDILASGNLEAHKEVAAIKQAYYSLTSREAMNELEKFVEAGNPAEQFSSSPDPLENEVKALLAEFREKRTAFLEQKEEERRGNLEKKNEIIAELGRLADDIDSVNLHFPKFQELQASFKSVGDVPPGSDNEVWKRYQGVVEQFYDRLKMNKELRDLDFKKNLEIKQTLIAKAKELAEKEDVIEAFRKLQDLHDQWRQIGPVAKELREDTWNEFKEASTVINKRHQDFFQNRKAEEQENENRKLSLCEKVEAIKVDEMKNFSDWDAKTKEIIELQKEYKEIGFAPRKSNSELFARFRKACDDFFTAKADYFKKTKDEFRDNLAKKESLCEKAEALVARAQEKSAFDELQALQKEWRTIGVVRRKQGDEVWKRFCAALDAFYAARKAHFGAQRSVETENLKAKQAIIEQLKAISEDSERKDVIGKIRDLQDEWQKIGFVPFKHKESVNSEYRNELHRLFSAFDMQQNTQRMKRFEGEVKRMEGDKNSLGRERDRLIRAMEARQNEIKTIENNLGFFSVKSSAGNSMLKEFERKINKIKEEIAGIKEKIALLDAQK